MPIRLNLVPQLKQLRLPVSMPGTIPLLLSSFLDGGRDGLGSIFVVAGDIVEVLVAGEALVSNGLVLLAIRYNETVCTWVNAVPIQSQLSVSSTYPSLHIVQQSSSSHTAQFGILHDVG